MPIELFIITGKDTLQVSKKWKIKFWERKIRRFRIREKHVMNSLLDDDVAARDTINELLDDEHETGQKFVHFPALIAQTSAYYRYP